MALVSEFCLIAGSVDLGGIESSRKKLLSLEFHLFSLRFFTRWAFFLLLLLLSVLSFLLKGILNFPRKLIQWLPKTCDDYDENDTFFDGRFHNTFHKLSVKKIRKYNCNLLLFFQYETEIKSNGVFPRKDLMLNPRFKKSKIE